MAEKINKNERKNNAEIIIEEFSEESIEFRNLLKMNDQFDSSVDVQVNGLTIQIISLLLLSMF